MFSLEEKNAQNRGENFSQKLGGRTWEQNWGDVAPDFNSRFGGIKATEVTPKSYRLYYTGILKDPYNINVVSQM